MFIVAVLLFALAAIADDRPIPFKRLPDAAQKFINANFPEDKVLHALKDDDLIAPDYEVMMESGVKIDFNSSGKMESVSSPMGVPASIVPAQIHKYVKAHYPDAVIVEYDVDRYSHEIKLNNRMELEFNSAFNLVEVDY